MIDLLPPEVLRKGRFDEVFFIDLPGAREREAIWQVHVQRHGIALKKYPPSELAKMTAHYNGSEIEQVVVNATLAAIAAGKEPTDHELLQALGQVVPLARTMAEKIQEIRRWASDRAVRASPPAE
jgi:SpoVK/Ycf46/Vps4 family AAA+-type ATPase